MTKPLLLAIKPVTPLLHANGKCHFFCLLTFLLNLVKGSLQDELDGFFQQIASSKKGNERISKAAFTKSRKYLKHSAFVELREELNRRIYSTKTMHTWEGFRLCAIDGSRLNLPNTPEVIKEFGLQKRCIKPQAKVSQCFDVLNQLTLDIEVAPYTTGEREIAQTHISKLTGNDLFIYDRGYPAFWFYALHQQQEKDFCMRLPSNGIYKYARNFQDGKENDIVIDLPPQRDAKRECKARGLPYDAIKLRLIKVILPSGEKEILITTLLDKRRYPTKVFKSLYHLRWPVEEDFKTVKQRLQIERFSGKSVHAVMQDIHAKVLSKNIIQLLINEASKEIETQYGHRKHRYRINRTEAISKSKHTLAKVIMGITPLRVIRYLLDTFLRVVEPIRNGRRYSRKRPVGTRMAVAGTYKPVR